jgi:hypothetical protein
VAFIAARVNWNKRSGITWTPTTRRRNLSFGRKLLTKSSPV